MLIVVVKPDARLAGERCIMNEREEEIARRECFPPFHWIFFSIIIERFTGSSSSRSFEFGLFVGGLSNASI